MSLNDLYWTAVETMREQLKQQKPTTADAVVAILREYDPQGNVGVAGDAFYSGGNADEALWADLAGAGWGVIWQEAPYYYVMRQRITGDRLTYIEGDVYKGDQRA